MRQKNSKQLQLIKENLSLRTDHPTAEMIYFALKQMLPSLSLATVYRNLCSLEEQHLVRKIQNAGQSVRYDGNLAPHDHFVCENCGTIIDVFPNEDSNKIKNNLQKNAETFVQLKISSANITYCGMCTHCSDSLKQ